jgi:hypothetical protein
MTTGWELGVPPLEIPIDDMGRWCAHQKFVCLMAWMILNCQSCLNWSYTYIYIYLIILYIYTRNITNNVSFR